MRYILTIIAIAMLLLVNIPIGATPVYAEKYGDMIGKKVVTSSNTDVEYLGGKLVDGEVQYQYRATIHQAPIYNDDGTPVNCQWYGSGNSYYIKDNVFSATATGAQIEIEYNGETSSWNPVVMIDGKQYTAIGNPKIINDSSNANYVGNVLEWDYGICKRHLRVIEGLIQDLWIFESDPGGNVWIRDNATKSKGFTWEIEPYAYDANGEPIAVNQYKQVAASVMASAVYPVTIDPTEVFVTSASDGHAIASGNVYLTQHDAANAANKYDTYSYLRIGQTFSTPTYSIWRAYVYFDTSALPDGSSITAANLSLYGSLDNSTADFNIVVQNGQPTYPHDPLELGDWDYTKYAGAGSAFSTAGFVTTGYNNISLTAAGLTYISLTSTTKLALLSSEDIAASPPAGTEYVQVYSYEKGAGYRPTLYVTYASSGAPTVTTNPATYVTRTSARLNGYLDNDGGGGCVVRFQYARWNGSAWVGNTSTANQSMTTGESFIANLTGLTNNSTYAFRAEAENGVGTGNGSWVNFSTSVVLGAPSNVLADPSGTSIGLTWTKGGNSSNTYIRYKVGSYPTGLTDGNYVTLEDSTGYTHAGLIPGTSYYYRLWGEDSGDYSATNVTVMMTTLIGSSTAATPDAPEAIDNWTGELDDTLLEDLPVYEFGNLIADEGGIPYATFWGAGSLVLIAILVFIFYNKTHNTLLTGLIAIIGLIALGALQVIPYALTALFIMVALAVTVRESRNV